MYWNYSMLECMNVIVDNRVAENDRQLARVALASSHQVRVNSLWYLLDFLGLLGHS